MPPRWPIGFDCEVSENGNLAGENKNGVTSKGKNI
jgi:hypothetical protein